MLDLFFTIPLASFFILGILCLLILTAVANNEIFPATIVVLVSLLTAQWFSSFHPFTEMYNDPLASILFLSLYLAIGSCWGILKWWSYIHSIKRSLQQFINNNSSSTVDKAYYVSRMFKQDLPPKISKNKSRFMCWIAYWPISFIWTIINDPVTRLFQWIFNSLSTILQNISDHAFKDLK